MKKIFLLLLMMPSLLIWVACDNETSDDEFHIIVVKGNFPHYHSIEDLAEAATDIVRVEILDERVEWINIWLPPENEYEDTGESVAESYHLFTVYQAMVLESFQGDFEVPDVIEVKQLGGQLDDTLVIHYDKVPFDIGDDLVLFLQTFDDDQIPASLLNPGQSAYFFTRRSRELESLDLENELTLSMEDLENIYENDN